MLPADVCSPDGARSFRACGRLRSLYYSTLWIHSHRYRIELVHGLDVRGRGAGAQPQAPSPRSGDTSLERIDTRAIALDTRACARARTAARRAKTCYETLRIAVRSRPKRVPHGRPRAVGAIWMPDTAAAMDRRFARTTTLSEPGCRHEQRRRLWTGSVFPVGPDGPPERRMKPVPVDWPCPSK